MSHEQPLSLTVSGQALLEKPLWNKGTAFTKTERLDLDLLGLLPPHVETLDEQASRYYERYSNEPTVLDKHVYLRNLQDENETLFYRLLLEHLDEMMPVIYTPVVGDACENFSEIYRRPRGLFVAYPERAYIDAILSNAACARAQVIVVTDGERILGLGDQGAGGMGIPIGKLSLYTAIGGIDPATTLPIFLDVGTDNPRLLNDPDYIGWRHARIRGKAYDDFIEKFVASVIQNFPDALLQWEDFAGANATRLLEKYRDRLCTFNDDVQGTAAVVTGTLMAAVAATGGTLANQRICILGAGSAGCGVGEQLVRAMMVEGLDERAARAQFYLVDANGLMLDTSPDLRPFQRRFTRKSASLREWTEGFSLIEVMRRAKPTVLIGLTGHAGSFTESAVREMSVHTERPIIFPLSNPTSRAEATPCDILRWTNGQAIIACGSPFAPLSFHNTRHTFSQCNNSYIFPAMGLAVLAIGASRVTDEMFMVAALALKESSDPQKAPGAPLLPPLNDARQISREIAIAIALQAQAQGVTKAKTLSRAEVEQKIDRLRWTPRYVPMRKSR